MDLSPGSSSGPERAFAGRMVSVFIGKSILAWGVWSAVALPPLLGLQPQPLTDCVGDTLYTVKAGAELPHSKGPVLADSFLGELGANFG